MEFRNKLKELRNKNNLTQKKLADKIFVSRSAIAKWENGFGLPSDDLLEALCNEFNVSKNELLCNKEEEENYVKKNNIIFKQKGFIIGLLSSVSLLLVVTITLIVLLSTSTNKSTKYTSVTYYAPAITINDNNRCYHTNAVVSDDESIIYKRVLMLELDDLKKLDASPKASEYKLNVPEYESIDAYYYYLTDDRLYMNMEKEKPYIEDEINDMIGWYNDTTYYKATKVDNNVLSIPENDYKNLIRIDLTIDGHTFQYFFLFE
ncbi:MAG: helix-turn-helix transcriptional regulator [Bacilli bacterium]|nr:helix-turn-helix transcriptional regulator [Bacilli bacterium]MBR4495831.1 helix-turn-helix transcriptional regulator [Acholeplasmatales bacterium]